MRTMKDPEKYSSLFLVLLGLAALCGSASLGLGTFRSPGPGLLPFLAAVTIFLSSTIHFLSRTFSKDESLKNLWGVAGWPKVVIYVTITLVIYTTLFESLGFILSTFFLMMVLLNITGRGRLLRVLIESVLITLTTYVFFEMGLSIGFPKGVLGF